MFEKINIANLSSKFKFSNNNGFDDIADCLNFKITANLLGLSSAIILFKQYFMKPISCYMTTNIGGNNLIEYIENYCWVEGTIPITHKVEFPTNEEEWERIQNKKIVYYQWVPFILLVQAIMFYLPHLIWRLFYTKQSGRDLGHLMVKANNASDMDSDSKTKEVLQLAHTLENLIFPRKELTNGDSSFLLRQSKNVISLCKRLGSSLMFYYIFVKVLYLCNSIAQVYIMQAFLNLNNTNYSFYGTKILHDIINGRDWQNTLVFSRVAYCFAKIRLLGGVNFAVAQCVLPFNMLNEKVYIFFWFWIVFIAIVTAISILVWVIRLRTRNRKSDFIHKYLILNEDYKSDERMKRKIKLFAERFFHNDGIFILQMLASNAGEIITAEIVGQLWKIFKQEKRQKRKDSIYPTENQVLKLNSLKIEEKCKGPRPSAPTLYRQTSLDNIHFDV